MPPFVMLLVIAIFSAIGYYVYECRNARQVEKMLKETVSSYKVHRAQREVLLQQLVVEEKALLREPKFEKNARVKVGEAQAPILENWRNCHDNLRAETGSVIGTCISSIYIRDLLGYKFDNWLRGNGYKHGQDNLLDIARIYLQVCRCKLNAPCLLFYNYELDLTNHALPKPYTIVEPFLYRCES